MKISAAGKALIKSFEGCRLSAYLDSVGVPTIAWGRTKDVKMGDTCTQEQADAWFDEEMPEYEGYINDSVTVPLEQHQFDALTSFVYNLGPASLRHSTLLLKLNQGNYIVAADEFPKWNRAGGKVLAGLTRRRQAERAMFIGLDGLGS